MFVGLLEERETRMFYPGSLWLALDDLVLADVVGPRVELVFPGNPTSLGETVLRGNIFANNTTGNQAIRTE